MDDLAREIAARDAAFERGDLKWAAAQMPGSSSPKVVEMAFHKARMECLNVSDEKRRESLAWLADRGLTDMGGRPVRHDDPLPR